MIVLVPVAYSVKVVPKGKRNPVNGSCKAWVPVAVDEVPEDSLKLAFRTADAGKSVADQPEQEIFAVGKRLVSPCEGATAENLSEIVQDHRDERNPFRRLQTRGGIGGRSMTDQEMSEIREMVSTDRESREADIRHAAARMLMVGGRLYSETPEPVWQVVTIGRTEKRVCVLLRPFPFDPHRTHQDAVAYRADRFDDALAFARSEAARQGLDAKEVHVDADCQFVDPEALSFDDENASLLKAAEKGQVWKLGEGHHDLDGVQAEFDRAVSTGLAGEATCTAVEELMAWMRTKSLADFAEELEPFVSRWRSRARPAEATSIADIEDADLAGLGR